jgi:hypothetical protein
MSLAAAMLALAAGASAATATTYYVDCLRGSDAATGTTHDSAWRSLSPVNNRALAPGDVVALKRGCAWDGGLTARSSGTAESRILYRAYGTGAAPVIRNTTGGRYGSSVEVTGDHNVVDGLSLRDAGESGVMIRAGADRNVVRRTDVTSVGLGVVANGRYNRLAHNYVHDLRMLVNTAGGDDDYGAVCFWIAAPDNEVAYNRGVNCRAASYDYGYDGGFVEVWKAGDNTRVHHNYARNTSGFFELGGAGSARGIRVSNNILRDVHGGLCLHNGGMFQIALDDFRFDHNTYYSSTGGYRFLDCVSGLTPSMVIMRNNVFHSDVRIAGSGNFTHVANLYHMTGGATVGYALGAGERIGDPRFVDPAAGNFHLQAESPAIDAGVMIGYTLDFDGRARPVGAAPDAGAYEYAGDAAP